MRAGGEEGLMDKIGKNKYRISSAVAVAAAGSTVVPAKASKACALGYYAHCSWAPWSTLVCLVIAGAIWWIGMRRQRA